MATPQQAQPRTLNQDPERLKRRRVAAGLTLTDVRAEHGVDVSWLSELENGHKNAGPRMLARLAAAYGCEITDLMPSEAGS